MRDCGVAGHTLLLCFEKKTLTDESKFICCFNHRALRTPLTFNTVSAN
jgi:hypothetical protein